MTHPSIHRARIAGRRPAIVELAELLHEGSRELLALVGADGVVHPMRTGSRTEALLGWSSDEILADPIAYVHADDRDQVRDAFRAAAAMDGASATVSFRARHAHESWVTLEATFVNRRGHPWIQALVVRLRREEDDASFDEESGDRHTGSGWRAAGLATRTDLVAAIDRQLRHKRARSGGDPNDRRWDFTVVLLELHDFRRIRNSFPRPLVDELVLRIAERFEPLLAPHDLLAYLEEGSFGIVLTAVGNAEEATRAADRFLDALDERFEVGAAHVTVSPMVGLATSERDYQSPDELLRDASSAIGKAAERKRRRLAAFRTQIRAEDRHRIQLLADMALALDEDAFHVAYQPIIRLHDRALMGFEALARWRHPTRGEISPSEFIPLAEESGFIDRLGEQILSKSCRQMAEWTRDRPALKRLTVSVNISGAQLGDPCLLSIVERALRDSGLTPEQLRLEMTESMVLEDIERAASAIARLRLYGVTFSLDDFGTGYSSLSLLHRLDYEVIKIDRSFLAKRWETNQKIVAAIVSLAHSLSMKVVAEGVETIDQARALLAMRCDAAQGYLYSPPLTAAAATRLVEGARTERR